MIQYIPILNIQYCKGHLISGNMITMLFGMMCRHVGSVPQHLGAGSWAATWLQHWIHISPALRARIRNHGETCKFTRSNSSFDQSLQPREYTSPEQSWWNAVLLFVQGTYPWRFIKKDGIIFHVSGDRDVKRHLCRTPNMMETGSHLDITQPSPEQPWCMRYVQ